MANENISNNRPILRTDYSETQDLIGIDEDAMRFAGLISSKNMKPPLTIGIFGNWGSGKTFFMNRISKYIHFIKSGEALAVKPLNQDKLCNIAQIKFNAWQYVESNLWASLVKVIFEGIEKCWPGDQSQEFYRIISQLETSIRVQEEKEIELERVTSELNQINEKKRALNEDKEKLELEIEKLNQKDPWTDNEYLFRGTQKQVSAEKFIEDDWRYDLRKFIRRFGLENTVRNPKELRDTLQGFYSIRKKIALIFTDLFSRVPNAIIAWSLVTYYFFFGVYRLMYPSAMTSKINAEPVFWERLLEKYVFSELSFLLMILFTVLLVAAQSIALPFVIKRFRRLYGSIREQLRQDTDEIKHFKQLAENNLSRVNTELIEVENQIGSFEKITNDLESAIDREGAYDRLAQYISQRAEGVGTNKHVGMLALMRQDFRKLSDMLVEESPAGNNNVDRIVLYIDDLDRCPADRVVNVLEAIHLLLAFPLFVVIVAVDVRWLSKSINKHFAEMLLMPELLDQNKNPQKMRYPSTTVSATTQDYLEKIFQVPYWLPLINHGACLNLIHGFLSPPKSVDNNLAFDIDKMTSDLKRKEVKCIERLSSVVVRTPRSLMRFMNVYLFLRAEIIRGKNSKLSYSESALILLLLALIHGVPIRAPHMLNHLNKLDENTSIKQHFENLDFTTGVGGSPEWERIKPTILGYVDETYIDLKAPILKKWVRRVRQFSFLDYHS